MKELFSLASVSSARHTTDIVETKVTVNLLLLTITIFHFTSGETRFGSGDTKGGARTRTRNCASSS